jgi:hypothetical protein
MITGWVAVNKTESDDSDEGKKSNDDKDQFQMN